MLREPYPGDVRPQLEPRPRARSKMIFKALPYAESQWSFGTKAAREEPPFS